MIIAQERFGTHIPPEHAGYEYIGETKIFCPYYVVGLEAIKKTETALSYVYETVLRFVDLGVCSVQELCKWMGLHEAILAQIISDMAVKTNLIDASKKNIILTTDGRKALERLRSVRYEKFSFNEIYINAITGEILDMPQRGMLSQPPRPFPYFDSIIDIDLAFMDINFEKLSSVYKKRRERDEELGSEDLFRVLSITYSNLKYAPLRIQLYVHSETRKLLVIFPGNESIYYSSAFYAQLNQKTPGSRWLFELDQGNVQSWLRPRWNQTKAMDSLHNAISAYRGNIDMGTEGLSDFTELYQRERSLLSGEIMDLLQSAYNRDCREIIIMSSHILKFLTDDELVSYWKAYLGDIKLKLIYTECEDRINENVRKAKKSLLNNLTEKQQQCIEWHIIPERIDRTIVICSPGYVIGASYSYETIADASNLILAEHAAVSFDIALIDRWKKLASAYVDWFDVEVHQSDSLNTSKGAF